MGVHGCRVYMDEQNFVRVYMDELVCRSVHRQTLVCRSVQFTQETASAGHSLQPTLNVEMAAG